MSVILTEAGYGECERTLGTSMFDPKDPWAPFVLGALRAKELLLRDRDYLVTFQALFRTLSSRLAGMTGTALSDGKELGDVYKLTVVPIPTALPIARKDYDDAVYRTLLALAAEGRAIASKSPAVAALRKALAALEADLGAALDAERAAVVRAGGLYVVGTERHESVRIDNQLRGRSGRQGDAGASRFFVSVDDPMFKTFGGDQIAKLMETFRVGDDLPLEAKSVTENLGKIQAKVEAYNADLRVNVLKFDDVLDGQRRALYATRRRLLLDGADDAAANAREWAADALSPSRNPSTATPAPTAASRASRRASTPSGPARSASTPTPSRPSARARRRRSPRCPPSRPASAAPRCRRGEAASAPTESFTKLALIRLDKLWADHLLNMNYAESVQLRTLQQTDPFQGTSAGGLRAQTKIKADTICPPPDRQGRIGASRAARPSASASASREARRLRAAVGDAGPPAFSAAASSGARARAPAAAPPRRRRSRSRLAPPAPSPAPEPKGGAVVVVAPVGAAFAPAPTGGTLTRAGYRAVGHPD
ncbi:ATPase-coupled protein transmembrane transporter [Aureococcus anophagefferens]|nr:ATPase-coupled protein transmembrane transporter [Aureococcus anophagefferens]